MTAEFELAAVRMASSALLGPSSVWPQEWKALLARSALLDGCIMDPMGEASGAELLHPFSAAFSAIYLSADLAASLPAHKQSEQPQIQATAGVIPANTNALCSSGLSLVAGLTTLPTCTSKETYTTSPGEACSFPPSCKRSRQPAKTSPTKGFPQHLLQRWILAFSVNAATSAPCCLPP